jgi:hypothetical protein
MEKCGDGGVGTSHTSDIRQMSVAMQRLVDFVSYSIEITDPNPQQSKNDQREKGINWAWVPDGCLTPRRTGRLM